MTILVQVSYPGDRKACCGKQFARKDYHIASIEAGACTISKSYKSPIGLLQKEGRWEAKYVGLDKEDQAKIRQVLGFLPNGVEIT